MKISEQLTALAKIAGDHLEAYGVLHPMISVMNSKLWAHIFI